MSQTQSVNYGGRGFWAYDVALSILLRHVIDIADFREVLADDCWLARVTNDWRRAIVAGYGLEIEESWSAVQLGHFKNLITEACQRLQTKEIITGAEIATWPPILDDIRIPTRGASEISTEPIAELGKAIIALTEGTLPDSPNGTWWCFGTPEGRTTIQMRNAETTDLGQSRSLA